MPLPVALALSRGSILKAGVPNTDGTEPMPKLYGVYLDLYLRAVLDKDKAEAFSVINGFLKMNSDPAKAFGMIAAAQTEVGDLWASNAISVGDEHFATEVALEAITVIASQFRPARRDGARTALVVGGVEGEFHHVGARMFAASLEIEGWRVDFLTNLSTKHLLDYAKGRKGKIDLVSLGVSLRLNLPALETALADLRRLPELRETVIIVGGSIFRDPRLKRRLIKAKGHGALANCVCTTLDEGMKAAMRLTAGRLAV